MCYGCIHTERYSMLGQVTSPFVAGEAFIVSHVLCSFSWGEIDPVYVHGVGVPGWSGDFGCLSWQNAGFSPTSELPESYHILVELSCLIELLFPFPASLFLSFWEGGVMWSV